ncbi:MAG: nicotinamide mononucleotide transporter [Clostridia bacterium]|nr:nicotinamide mononucleotide transporter [Clostridia bacterium]
MKFIGKLKTSEYVLWAISSLVVIISFFISNTGSWLNLVASLVGVAALIFIAKGYPICHVCFIVFAVLYGIISYDLSYYGEMITYLGMSLPVSIISLLSWLKHPFKEGSAEVSVRRINKKQVITTFALTIVVTVIFYFILKALNTANLIVSTISVATSFTAAYLSFLRSPYYALGYVANDVVLIVLWLLATIQDISYLSVTVCFTVFLVNDTYGFISWQRMERRQNSECN